MKYNYINNFQRDIDFDRPASNVREEGETIQEKAERYMNEKIGSIPHHPVKFLIRNAFEDGQTDALKSNPEGEQVVDLSKRIEVSTANYKNHIESLDSEIATLQSRLTEVIQDYHDAEQRVEKLQDESEEAKDDTWSERLLRKACEDELDSARHLIAELTAQLSEEKAKHGQIAEKAWNENTGALIRVLTPKNGIRGAITAIRLITKLGHLHDKEKKNYLKQFLGILALFLLPLFSVAQFSNDTAKIQSISMTEGHWTSRGYTPHIKMDWAVRRILNYWDVLIKDRLAWSLDSTRLMRIEITDINGNVFVKMLPYLPLGVAMYEDNCEIRKQFNQQK